MGVTSSNEPTNRSDEYDATALSRYDLVLAVIPVTFMLAGLGSVVFSVTPHVLLVAATLVSAVAVFDGLFVNPPRPGSRVR